MWLVLYSQHAVVLRQDDVIPDPLAPSSATQPPNSTIQLVNSQRSPKPGPSHLAPRVSSIKDQGFSDQVAARIEVSKRSSARAIYNIKWSLLSDGVTGRRRVKQIDDFLMHLFQNRNH